MASPAQPLGAALSSVLGGVHDDSNNNKIMSMYDVPRIVVSSI